MDPKYYKSSSWWTAKWGKIQAVIPMAAPATMHRLVPSSSEWGCKSWQNMTRISTTRHDSHFQNSKYGNMAICVFKLLSSKWNHFVHQFPFQELVGCMNWFIQGVAQTGTCCPHRCANIDLAKAGALNAVMAGELVDVALHQGDDCQPEFKARVWWGRCACFRCYFLKGDFKMPNCVIQTAARIILMHVNHFR